MSKVIQIEGWMPEDSIRFQAEKDFSELEDKIVFILPIYEKQTELDDVKVRLTLEVAERE